jgi:hypothetical protein
MLIWFYVSDMNDGKQAQAADREELLQTYRKAEN